MSWLLPFFRGWIWRWVVRLCYSAYRTHARTHAYTEWQIYRDGLSRIQADILPPVSDIAYTSKCLWVFMGMSHVCSSEVPSRHTRTLVHSLTFYSRSKRVSPRGLPFKSDPCPATVNHFTGHHGPRRFQPSGRDSYEETDKQPVPWKYGGWQIWKTNIPWGHRAWVVNDRGVFNRQSDYRSPGLSNNRQCFGCLLL